MPDPLKSSRWGAKAEPAKPEVPKVAEVKAQPRPTGFQEYPKIVYRGEESLRVNNAEEEKLTATKGFGPLSAK